MRVGLRPEPALLSAVGQDQRHAVVDLRDKLVRGYGNDGEGANPFPALRLTPILQKPCNGEGCAVLHRDGVRLLRPRARKLAPIKKSSPRG